MAVDCKGCGLAGCSWRRDGKKWKLIAPDGSHHRCLAYRPKKKPAKLEIRKGPRVVGRDYSPSCGCDVPPWEECACSVSDECRTGVGRMSDESFNHMLDLINTP